MHTMELFYPSKEIVLTLLVIKEDTLKDVLLDTELQ